jgi:hypothetical protein
MPHQAVFAAERLAMDAIDPHKGHTVVSISFALAVNSPLGHKQS